MGCWSHCQLRYHNIATVPTMISLVWSVARLVRSQECEQLLAMSELCVQYVTLTH